MKQKNLVHLTLLLNIGISRILMKETGDRYLLLYFFRHSDKGFATTALYVICAGVACIFNYLYFEYVWKEYYKSYVSVLYALVTSFYVYIISMLITFIAYVIITKEIYLIEPLIKKIYKVSLENSKYWLILGVVNIIVYLYYRKISNRDGSLNVL